MEIYENYNISSYTPAEVTINTVKNNSNLRLFFVKRLSVHLDLAAIASVFALTFVRKALEKGYFRLWPFLFLFWLIFEQLGLYNGMSIHSGPAPWKRSAGSLRNSIIFIFMNRSD